MIIIRNSNGYGGITKLKGKRRRPYWVRVTVGWDVTPTGKAKQLYKTVGYFATRKEALIALAEYNSNPYDLANANLTFAEIFDKWSPKHFEKHSKSVEVNLRSAYNKCEPIKNMPIKDIRTAHLQAVMDSTSDLSLSTQVKVKTVMKNTFKWAMENDIIQKDYSEFVTTNAPRKISKKENFFTRDEIKRLLEIKEFKVKLTRNGNPVDLMDSVVVLLYTGMRIGELLNVRVEDVDLKERIIQVKGTKTESANRLVPIHKDIIPVLEKRMNGEYLFDNETGGQITYIKYKALFWDALMKHLEMDFTPHATRHTFISRMDACGISSQSVVLKRIVGHSNASVTEHYTHTESDRLIEAIDKFEL